jgi:hypothetical protein
MRAMNLRTHQREPGLTLTSFALMLGLIATAGIVLLVLLGNG